MDFDLENLIYIFGALAYFASAIFGWFKEKNKKKGIEDEIQDNKEIQEDKIPKTFQDLVDQVKSELSQDDKEIVESLKRGDKVVTSGGIVGTVERIIDNDKVEINIADSVNVEVVRATGIQALLNITEQKK